MSRARLAGLLRTVAALGVVFFLGLAGLDVYGIYLREARHHVFVQVYNLDDEATVLLNGNRVLQAGYGDKVTRDLGWLAKTDEIETRFVNRGGTYTWGVRVSDANGQIDLDDAGVIDGIGADDNATFEGVAPVRVHCRSLHADGSVRRVTCGSQGGNVKPLERPPIPRATSFRDRLVVASPTLTAALLISMALAAIWMVSRRMRIPYHRAVERLLALGAIISVIFSVTNALFGV